MATRRQLGRTECLQIETRRLQSKTLSADGNKEAAGKDKMSANGNNMNKVAVEKDIMSPDGKKMAVEKDIMSADGNKMAVEKDNVCRWKQDGSTGQNVYRWKEDGSREGQCLQMERRWQ